MSKQQWRLRFIEGGEGGGAPGEPASTDEAGDNGEPKNDDEPLGEPGKKALDAERATNKELRARIKELEAATPNEPDPGVADRLAALEKQLADSEAARQAAEVTALRAKHGAGLPDDLAALITGTTEDDIKTQVETLSAYVKPSGPRPNPQQGTPPGKTGGSIAAGRDRYQQSLS